MKHSDELTDQELKLAEPAEVGKRIKIILEALTFERDLYQKLEENVEEDEDRLGIAFILASYERAISEVEDVERQIFEEINNQHDKNLKKGQ